MQLPLEDKVHQHIRLELKPELDLATEILELGTGVFTSGTPMHPGDGLDDYVVITGLGLVAKACKQYRAIGMLVEAGLAEVADSNARMLLETMLAVNFILRRTVILKENGVKVRSVPGKLLTTRFRTSLYLANNAFNERKFVRSTLETPGLRRKIPVTKLNHINRIAADWETEIGAEWTKRLKKKGYSGVSVKDLAESLGYGQLYATTYRLSSAGVHASDASSHVQIDDDLDGEWRFYAVSSSAGVARILGFASLMLVMIVQAANNRLGLSLKEKTDELLVRAQQMRLDF